MKKNGAMSGTEATSATAQRKTCCNSPKLPPFLALNPRSTDFIATGGSIPNMTGKALVNPTREVFS